MSKSLPTRRVAVVAVCGPDGEMLWGKRADDGKYTTPAGHLNPGEEPAEGAARELWEEAGIQGRPS